MLVNKLRVWCLVVLGAALLAGCQQAKVTSEKPSAKAPRIVNGVALPSWAPEKPSPELLRALKTLKPIPEEASKYEPNVLAAFEFFGTLTDAQVAKFVKPTPKSYKLANADADLIRFYKEKYNATEQAGNLVWQAQEIWLPVKGLTPEQYQALLKVVAAGRAGAPGGGEEGYDVALYRAGASKDFSNAMVSFVVMGHAVDLHLTVQSGKGMSGFGGWVAQL